MDYICENEPLRIAGLRISRDKQIIIISLVKQNKLLFRYFNVMGKSNRIQLNLFSFNSFFLNSRSIAVTYRVKDTFITRVSQMYYGVKYCDNKIHRKPFIGKFWINNINVIVWIGNIFIYWFPQPTYFNT